MKFISAYLLAATVVETGSYEEEYYIEEDPEFAEFMEEGGSEIVGDYIELLPPTGGSAGAATFSGDEFCEDWLSAFVRPIEYAQIYDAKAGISPTYPDTGDESDWADFKTVQSLVGEVTPIAEFFDNKVYANTNKHANVWFAAVQLEHPSVPNNRLEFGLWGVYMPSNVQFKIKENHPIQGYSVFDVRDKQGNIYYPTTSSNYNWYRKRYVDGAFVENSGTSNIMTNFVLVYNVDAFKAYLENMSTATIDSFLSNTYFVLAECNVKKDKVQGQTDWSDNDDYHGE